MIPFSVRRELARKARTIANYVQGTMGLEGQGVSQEYLRECRRVSYRKLIAWYTVSKPKPTKPAKR